MTGGKLAHRVGTTAVAGMDKVAGWSFQRSGRGARAGTCARGGAGNICPAALNLQCCQSSLEFKLMFDVAHQRGPVCAG